MLVSLSRISPGDASPNYSIREASGDFSSLLASLQNRENIVCVNEYIPLRQVPDYFFASDLVVLPM
jgi:hypothetical protein